MGGQAIGIAPIRDFTVTDDEQFIRDTYDKQQHQNGK